MAVLELLGVRLLDRSECMNLLGLTSDGLRNFVKKHGLKSITVARKKYYRESDLQAVLSGKPLQANPTPSATIEGEPSTPTGDEPDPDRPLHFYPLNTILP